MSVLRLELAGATARRIVRLGATARRIVRLGAVQPMPAEQVAIELLCGGLGGQLAAACVHPLDVLKTRCPEP